MQCYIQGVNGGIYRAMGSANHLDGLPGVVKVSIAFLKEIQADPKTHFDVIIAGGMSGGLIASPCSIALKVPLIIARDTKLVSGHRAPLLTRNCFTGLESPKVVFLDDTVSSGTTRRAAQTALWQHARQLITHQFLYCSLLFTKLSKEDSEYPKQG